MVKAESISAKATKVLAVRLGAERRIKAQGDLRFRLPSEPGRCLPALGRHLGHKKKGLVQGCKRRLQIRKKMCSKKILQYS